eukprot:CAMPEP_0117009946 /NCGR_PEP_ID=MMETSP0472-20121206/8897_1 /TAXON_ID=693140 ORGANISM="Tiarina fusus, Strain LIS" /NCGR_SAMPLE_ID=MMETSP0472 /ASSEMBLY_ACC=CAM_ASM_000603 /LENGTH=255 /DNA_ID=CAMNT_0004712365 /DNA_START=2497 /DNA_END=3264 /DNA_ORIENTATION=+
MAKIADFGIANFAFLENEKHYEFILPPEYPVTKKFTVQCDIYAFGLCLLSMLACQTNYTTLQYYIQQNFQAFDDIPREFVDIVRNCLKKDPAVRYQSFEDIFKDLCKFGAFIRDRDANARANFGGVPAKTNRNVDICSKPILLEPKGNTDVKTKENSPMRNSEWGDDSVASGYVDGGVDEGENEGADGSVVSGYVDNVFSGDEGVNDEGIDDDEGIDEGGYVDGVFSDGEGAGEVDGGTDDSMTSGYCDDSMISA